MFMCDRMRTFLLFIYSIDGPTALVTVSMLINYRSSLDKKTEYQLGALKGFLKYWVEHRYPGIDSDVAPLLASWRFRGCEKGRAIQMRCPEQGALSSFEYEALQSKLLDTFMNEEISLADFVLVTLFSATGRRPSQIADLKANDLIKAFSSDGLTEYFLNIPRRKQRGRGWRSDFKPVRLTPEIALAVSKLLETNKITFCELFPHHESAAGLLPIFPEWNAVKYIDSNPSGVRIMQTEIFHRKASLISAKIVRLVSSLSVPSERVRGTIRVFPTRLRRTLATRAAREGYGSVVIAELLDHSDDQNARVYTENVPEHVNVINQAVAQQLAPLAQAFAGVLVDVEKDALRGSDPTSRIRTSSGSSTGSCGHYGFCGALAPIACYTCRHFQPWLDGPHNEVLATLQADRSRLNEITCDPIMTSINDRTILAVTEVIQRCDARRIELRGELCLG
jgi:integrase